MAEVIPRRMLALALTVCSQGRTAVNASNAVMVLLLLLVGVSQAHAQSTPAGQTCSASSLKRTFQLPVPLFNAQSAWNQRADGAAVLRKSKRHMQTLHRAMRTIVGDWSEISLIFDEWTVPIFCANGRKRSRVDLCDYEGQEAWYNDKWTGTAAQKLGGSLMVPIPGGPVRPSSPAGTDSDGHLVLYDPVGKVAYEFWQATTERDSRCASAGGGRTGSRILEAGAIDFFDVTGSGTNAPRRLSSARATGVSLLAGLLLPEDVAAGEIRHAFAVAIPKPRNTASDPNNPRKGDIVYPAAWLETHVFNTDPDALASGQRIRLVKTLRDMEGEVIDESELAPVTRMVLMALRRYGAYITDNAGGFALYAEDYRTGVLRVSKAQVRRLVGLAPQATLDRRKSNWELVLRALAADLEKVPITVGKAKMKWSNFEVVAAARMNH